MPQMQPTQSSPCYAFASISFVYLFSKTLSKALWDFSHANDKSFSDWGMYGILRPTRNGIVGMSRILHRTFLHKYANESKMLSHASTLSTVPLHKGNSLIHLWRASSFVSSWVGDFLGVTFLLHSDGHYILTWASCFAVSTSSLELRASVALRYESNLMASCLGYRRNVIWRASSILC